MSERGGSDEERRRQGKMTREEAGRKGGEKVAKERGPEFYSRIGKKGGAASHGGGRQRENEE